MFSISPIILLLASDALDVEEIMTVCPSLLPVSSMSAKIQSVQEPGEPYHHSLPLLVDFQVVLVEALQLVVRLEDLDLCWQKNIQIAWELAEAPLEAFSLSRQVSSCLLFENHSYHRWIGHLYHQLKHLLLYFSKFWQQS